MLMCGVGLQVSECRSRVHFHVSPDNMLGQTYLNQPRIIVELAGLLRPSILLLGSRMLNFIRVGFGTVLMHEGPKFSFETSGVAFTLGLHMCPWFPVGGGEPQNPPFPATLCHQSHNCFS